MVVLTCAVGLAGRTSLQEAHMGGTDTIKLDQYLKWVGAVETGGQAKNLIQAGQVLVNGEVETRRGRQLRTGDKVQMRGEEQVHEVALTNPADR
jgi:ribosome-associated protein